MFLRKIIREKIEELLKEVESKRKKGKNRVKTKKRPYLTTFPINKPTGSLFYMDAAVSSISESVNLNEQYASRETPRVFDHLKWKLDHTQKQFLQDFIEIRPEEKKESDYEYASKLTGIPPKSIKSIQNTYSSWNKREKESIVKPKDYLDNGRFSVNSKEPLVASDYEISQKYRNDTNNFKKISKEEADKLRYPKKTLAQKKFEANMGNLTRGYLKKSDVRKKDNNYDDWLMYYIIGEAKPKKCILNKEKQQLEIDFEPSKDYYDFHKSMLNSNKKSKYWLSVESLINQFNEVFGSYYIVQDQYDLTTSKSNCIRIIVTEIPVSDKMIWNSDEKIYMPWDYASDNSKKEYINNKAWNLSKPAPEVDFVALLDKYVNFHNSMFNGF